MSSLATGWLLSIGFGDASAQARLTLLQTVSCLKEIKEAGCLVCGQPIQYEKCGPEIGTCTSTIEVWAANADYVAIRDIKMCGCPPDFVHGLVIPRAEIKGIGSANLPDGIWAYAWDIGRKFVTEESSLALAVNSSTVRSEHQLHVHIVRLRTDARPSFSINTKVSDLSEVWKAAAKLAGTRAAGQLSTNYGILVAKDGDTFVVEINAAPETKFTQFICRR